MMRAGRGPCESARSRRGAVDGRVGRQAFKDCPVVRRGAFAADSQAGLSRACAFSMASMSGSRMPERYLTMAPPAVHT